MTARVLLAGALILVPVLPATAQTVSLSLQDGRVTLVTQNATPAAILAEWARLGQVKVVDAERVPATPLTLRLENVPERQALDIVLRSAAGYIAAPRSQGAAGSVSLFDRVIVMASSPGASAAAKPAALQRPATTPAAAQPIVQNTPAQEEEVAQAQPVVVEEAPNGAATPEQPASSTNFDYANPQRYFAARQAEQQAADTGQQQQQQQQAQQPSTSPFGSLGQTTSRPGVVPTPQPQGTPAANGAAPANPYGLPPGQQPGSAPTASPLEPDRAKYINPYSPTPPRP